MLNQNSGDLDRVGKAEKFGVEGVTGSVTVRVHLVHSCAGKPHSPGLKRHLVADSRGCGL